MVDRLTYIDVLMYLLPGGWVLLGLVVVAWTMSASLPEIPAAGGLLNSVLFVFLAFILGNAVQAFAERGPQERLKRASWGGDFPSAYLFLAPGEGKNGLVSERLRQMALEYAKGRGWLTQEEEQSLEGPDASSTARLTSQRLFDQLRVLLAREDDRGRIRVAEAYYLFYRGMFTSSFWVAGLSVLPTVLLGLGWLLGFEVVASDRALTVLPVTAGSLWLWWLFRQRARGAALGFCKEVVRAAAVASAK